MSELNKGTFLRVLKGSPLSVLMALWIYGAMDRKQIMVKTGWKKAAVDDALAFLEDLELIERPHYRQWSLASGFYQLPLPFSEIESPKNGLSVLVSANPESPKNGTSADSEKSESPKNGTSANDEISESPKNGTSGIVGNSESPKNGTSEVVELAESPKNGLSAPPSDRSDRSDDEEEDEVDRFLPAHFAMSKHLLESIGIGGKELYQMAQYKPFEILAAWWYLLGSGWAKNPEAVLRSHLLKGHVTPRGYLDLSRWWFEHPDEHQDLVEVAMRGGHGQVIGLSPRGMKAAIKVCTEVGGLAL